MRLDYCIFSSLGGYSTDNWPEIDLFLSAQLYNGESLGSCYTTKIICISFIVWLKISPLCTQMDRRGSGLNLKSFAPPTITTARFELMIP